jgi:hypothetical protein
MFWCYLFPILLATCFFFAFNNLWSAQDFKTIKVAYDKEGYEADVFKEILTSAKMSDKKMFDVVECDKTKAKQMLENDEIEAYIVGSKDPVLYVKENGLNETIMKSFLDNYKQMSGTVRTILQENPNALNNGLMDDVMHYDTFIQETKNKKNPDAILIYFYALLAFTCIYASNWGMDEVINIQADLSERGARLNVSPTNKMKLFFCNLFAAFTVHLGSIVLMMLYLYYGIKIEFGDNMGYILFTCILGSFTGLALGGCVGIWVKKKAEIKGAILTLIVLGGGFLSGMMIADMKYIIAVKFPVLAYINPVNLISDSFYSLYYFDTYDRYYLDTAILGIITIILCIASYVGIRRKNYASI